MLHRFQPNVLLRVVETKLRTSGALLNAKLLRIPANVLNLSSDDSLIIEFPGLLQDSHYKMLVTFKQLDLLSDRSRRILLRIRDSLKLDLLIACTDESYTVDEVHALKNFGTQIVSLSNFSHKGAAFEAVPDFIHVPDLEYSRLLEINITANEVVKRLRKKFHLVLSEVAAEGYDSYGTFATREVMNFEDNLLRETLDSLLSGAKGSLAIDVGCGNGRHTVLLARHFRQVVAFDLSGRMINAARGHVKSHRHVDATGITFYECDVEYEEFPEELELSGKADFVCASFGMPSFVEDTFGFLRRVYTWLRPGGRALLTFYNAHSMALRVSTPWRERALSASIDIGRHALDVSLSESVRFSIYCRPYDQAVRDLIRIPFSILREGTFPHLMSILPPTIFGTDERPADDARHVVLRMDRAAAWERDFGKGHYVFLIVEKSDGASPGHVRVRHALTSESVAYQILDHTQVVSTIEVQKLLGLPDDCMLKTVLFIDESTDQFLVAVVGPHDRVDSNRLAQLASCDPRQVRLAFAQEVETRLGFPIGGVSPIGYDDGSRIFIDSSVFDRELEHYYMGAGDNRKTLKLSREVMLALLASHIRGHFRQPKGGRE
jgi:prolyl-tRNA editing enzyme YbaK/EbsC (Cys-tRNA(Pro) deacylase)/SAM-dependent methyltransferase